MILSKAIQSTVLKPIRPKRCNARRGGCGQEFSPRNGFQIACSPKCAQTMVEQKNAKIAAKVKAEEKAQDRAKRESLKTISQLEGECRKIAQKIARIRDHHDGCISCHMGPDYRGIWHGSHYRAHGACSSLQFHLWNIHKACEQCNVFKGGNKEGYIAGLIKKSGYGRERLDWLDSQPKSRKYSREYLARFKKVMSKRVRRMEKFMHNASNT